MILLSDPCLAALIDVVRGVVFTVFVLSALLLMLVILVQEGKGGGLGSAFGGAAADAFGVKAGTVNRFTSWLAAAFLGLALLYAGLSASGDKVDFSSPTAPGVTSPLPGESAVPPADDSAEPGAGEPAAPTDEGATPPSDGTPPPEAPAEPPPEAPSDPDAPGGDGGG